MTCAFFLRSLIHPPDTRLFWGPSWAQLDFPSTDTGFVTLGPAQDSPQGPRPPGLMGRSSALMRRGPGLGGRQDTDGGCTGGLLCLHLMTAPGLPPSPWVGPAQPLAATSLCRNSCASGQIVSLRCSGESYPGMSRKVAVGGGSLPPSLVWVWVGFLAHLPLCLLVPFLQTQFCPNRALTKPLSCPPPATDLGR